MVLTVKICSASADRFKKMGVLRTLVISLAIAAQFAEGSDSLNLRPCTTAKLRTEINADYIQKDLRKSLSDNADKLAEQLLRLNPPARERYLEELAKIYSSLTPK
jgi:hypothetical protein